MRFKGLKTLCYAGVLIPALSLAQQPAQHPQATDTTVKSPALNYESAFSGYTPFREEETADWRKVNDEVAAVGGHVGIVGGAGHAGHGNKPTVKPGASDTPASRAPATATTKPAPAKPAHH